ncbi:hypothetical protein OOK41_31790 [Micromonospora sp. NBC_01655]|uniref:hypothetical protein n=1 Tax=Micromonospora sp. NBC_01655 TaxID=2975983 RepID=UPI0022525B00|nr:hypothetical protein [Micromonospora sp. NBC_01655]MCX4474844.1 hypothetical protein [Micromonospora sp. NBC_01655]
MAALIIAVAVLAATVAVLVRLLVLADRQMRSLSVRVRHQADRIRALRAEARSRADEVDLLSAACDRLTARNEALRDELDARQGRRPSLTDWWQAYVAELPLTHPGDAR